MKKLTGLMAVAIGSTFLGGCASSSNTRAMELLQSNVVRLERGLNERDRQIESLKDEIAQLNERMDNANIRSNRKAIQLSSETFRAPQIQNEDESGRPGGLVRVDASVEKIQQALKQAGYYDGPIDGKLGSKSRTAIERFQKEHDLKVDGVVGAQTWKEMRYYLQ